MQIFKQFVFFLLLVGVVVHGDIWTAKDGNTLEGDLIRYDAGQKTITLVRKRDGEVFDVPENTFIDADRNRAIIMHNRKVKPYWFNDYDEVLLKRTNRNFILIYSNGTNPEALELWCHQVFSQPGVRELIEKSGFTICVQHRLPKNWSTRISPGFMGQDEMDLDYAGLVVKIYGRANSKDRGRAGLLTVSSISSRAEPGNSDDMESALKRLISPKQFIEYELTF